MPTKAEELREVVMEKMQEIKLQPENEYTMGIVFNFACGVLDWLLSVEKEEACANSVGTPKKRKEAEDGISVE